MKRTPWQAVFDGDLIPVEVASQLPVAKYGDEAFDAVSKAGKYLPRIQLMTANADKCKSGDFPINHYALVAGKNFEDLGTEVDVAVLAFRPKALEIGEQIINIFDPQPDAAGNATGEFKRIADASSVKNSGCMFGPEFLLWVPAIKQFATFFMGSISARNESPSVKAKIGKAATLRSQKIETRQYTWFAPQCIKCSTPFDMPENAALIDEMTKFNNPPVQEIETVDESETTSRER